MKKLTLYNNITMIKMDTSHHVFRNNYTSFFKAKIIIKMSYFLALLLTFLPNHSIAQVTNSNSLYTGNTDITIPITTISAKGLNVPIFLSYDASGNKVETISSNIGLGWSLKEGGQIKRYVRGIPDDYNRNDIDNKGLGWLHRINEDSHWIIDEYGFAYFVAGIDAEPADIVQERDLTQQSAESNWQLLNIFSRYWLDSEPDIFIFDLPGLNGEFYFDDARVIHAVDNVDLKFDYTFDVSKQISAFTITDGSGIKYIFGAVDKQSISLQGNHDFTFVYGIYGYPITISELTTTFNDTWHLTNIITPKGETITYEYEAEEYDLNPNIPTYKTGLETTENLTYTEYNISMLSNRITRISSDLMVIDFIRGESRMDLPGTYQISYIKIYSKLDTAVLKGYKLQHSYFQSVPDNASSVQLRLKLNSLFEYNLGASKPSYVFHYNEQDVLPSRNSKEQDLWGYFNQNGATSLIPKIHVYHEGCPFITCPYYNEHDPYRIIPKPNQSANYIIQGAERTPDIRWVNGNLQTVMDAFILNQIDNPEGGKTIFEYEPHQYNYEGNLYYGGGLRINKVTISDGDNDNANDIIKLFSYPNSGLLLYKPIYAYMSFPENDANAEGLVNNTLNSDRNNYFQKYLKVTSTNNTFNLGSPIVYGNVEVSESGNGKTKYTFEVNSLFDDLSSGYKTAVNHVLIDSPGITEMECNSCFQNFTVGCHYYITPTPEMGNDNYPFPNNENCNWKQGQLKKVEVFNESGNRVSESTYIYLNYYVSGSQPEYIYGLKYSTTYHPVNDQECRNCPLPVCIGHVEVCGNCETGNPQYVYGRYKVATDATRKLQSLVEKVYDPIDNAKFVTLTTNFTYTDYGQIATKEIVRSDGSSIKSELKYVQNYNNLSTIGHPLGVPNDLDCEGLYYLKYNHIVNDPIEVIQRKDGKVTSGTFTKFRYNATSHRVVPFQVYSLDINTPMSNFTFSDITYQGLSRVLNYDESNYVLKLTYDKYDNYGNVQQYHNNYGNNISFIWGYNNTLLIAEILNSAYNNTAYSGFESIASSGTGYYESEWTCGFATVHCDESNNPAYTGRCCIENQGSTITSVKTFPAGNYKISLYARNVAGYSGGSITITGVGVSPITPSGSTKWTYNERTFTLTTEQKIVISTSNGILIDELRLFPVNAQMRTYTHKPLVGTTSETDANNLTAFYQYDDLGRLILTKDNDGNITQKNNYNYSTPFITALDNSLRYPLSGGSRTITIYKNNIENYTITNDASWISFSISGETPDKFDLIITCPVYYFISRFGHVSVVGLTQNGGSITEIIEIYQGL